MAPTTPTAATTATVATSRTLLTPMGVSDVTLDGGFWGVRQTRNSDATIPHAIEWMTRLGWLENLEAAGQGRRYEHRGREFADSELYKTLEAIAWDHVRRGEQDLGPIADRLTAVFAAAQDPDGYLHTLFGRAWQAPRYSDFKWGHELYCFGHFIQSAVAHHRATGSDGLLNIARALGDHVCVMFGADGLNKVCGHAGIELALVELYRETGEQRYLDQASVFVERRGTGTLPLFEFGAAYWQDDLLVRDADVLRGHAVRALYLAAGAADVAVETGDVELLDALARQWDATIARRTYITGGMGSHHMDEAFGEDFVLPPDRSYCETCAGVASIMFSWRLLLATGQAKYADLIERTLYNIVATSPSEDGRAFFYANTLHQRSDHTPPPLNEDGVVIRGGAAGRQAWYEVSCCPPNVARTLASLGAYVATGDGRSVQIHQFVAGTINAGATVLGLSTDYPSTGRVVVSVERAETETVDVSIRVPAWADHGVLLRDGDARDVAPGYAVVEGMRAGDRFELILEMPLRLVAPDDRVDAVRGTVAFERGPEVFALESVDLPPALEFDRVRVDAAAAPRFDGDRAWISVKAAPRPAEAAWPYATPEESAEQSEAVEVPLVRYHEWAERGPSRMRIWIPTAE
ncbi:MAG TPA: beta-L-arabinofuranosidase domain-containing protein [Microbacterium sp.]|uniref:glycoside hydrolase family 127 protein n=1 Tax=Microbacterium sp. TaxID=51671 RepID=UPI002CBF4E46|nr:beta-L-arabinofuranosidase domain-containing protein [Microbacterium sp.]HWI30067.1 beta-L-arabinofuranosidase domain-containing protein [Microbacterium sp.]